MHITLAYEGSQRLPHSSTHRLRWTGRDHQRSRESCHGYHQPSPLWLHHMSNRPKEKPPVGCSNIQNNVYFDWATPSCQCFHLHEIGPGSSFLTHSPTCFNGDLHKLDRGNNSENIFWMYSIYSRLKSVVR